MSQSPWSSMWDLTAAQAQMEAVSAALMPVEISPSGRLQLPSVEVQETADALVITAFLPGVAPQAVDVRATSKVVTFSGQRQSGYRSPISYELGINYFQQVVPLPVAVQDRDMQVAYRQGAIVVTLPKARGFWANWRLARVNNAEKLWTLAKQLKPQGQRLAKRWNRLKGWLGHRL